MDIQLSWTDLKARLNLRGLALQYVETDAGYNLWAEEGPQVLYQCILPKDTPANVDQTDFETYYKADANAPVIQKIQGDIDAQVEDVMVFNYAPYIYESTTSIDILVSDTTLFDAGMFEGLFQGAWVSFNRNIVEVAFEVDGIEKMRFDLSTLGAEHGMVSASGANPDFPVAVGSSDKILCINFGGLPAYVASNFKLKARKTAGQTTTLYGIIIVGREKI